MKKYSLLIFLLALLTPLAFGQIYRNFQVRRASASLQALAASVPPQPAFTAVAEERVGAGEGETRLVHIHTYAVRGDQSVAERFAGPRPDDQRREISLASGLMQRVDDTSLAVSTQQVSAETVAERPATRLDPRSDCTVITASGARLYTLGDRGKILGVEVVEVKDAQGSRWLAPSLGCFEMRRKLQRTDSSGRVTSVNLYEVKSMNLGEPDPSLFAIPASYREVPPSELSRLWCLRRDCRLTPDQQKAVAEQAARLDAQYHAHRPVSR
jgi:hypothetical protein